MNADLQRRQRAGLSRRMREEAARWQCPECKRKYALNRVRLDAYSSAVVCRWCGYERAVTL